MFLLVITGNFFVQISFSIPQYCLPLLMEKLSSDITDAKIDSLLTLVSQCDDAIRFRLQTER